MDGFERIQTTRAAVHAHVRRTGPDGTTIRMPNHLDLQVGDPITREDGSIQYIHEIADDDDAHLIEVRDAPPAPAEEVVVQQPTE